MDNHSEVNHPIQGPLSDVKITVSTADVTASAEKAQRATRGFRMLV